MRERESRMQRSSIFRFTNLLVFVCILLIVVGVALYQVHKLLQVLVPTQQQLSASLSQMQWISNHGGSDFASAFERRAELERWQHAKEQNDMSIVQNQIQGLLKEAMTYKEDMEEVKDRVLELEREIREEMEEVKKGKYREEIMKEMKAKGLVLEREREDSLNASSLSLQKTPNAVQFSPLKDKTMQGRGDSHVHHYFMSAVLGRGMVEGPPELFTFPDSPSEPRLLCLRGNKTSDGAQNFYALASKEQVPTEAHHHLVPGITLLSDTFWDFNNPWHSMFNLLQFVYWRIDSGCSRADNLLLFHLGEFRTSMGSWIKSLLQACGLPTAILSMDATASSGGSHGSPPTVCFEKAVVSRSGIGGMKRAFLSRMFTEARCQARRACHVQHAGSSRGADEEEGTRRHVNVTLVVRQRARGFVDEAAWQRVVKEQCEMALNCSWSVLHVANFTFCQQVEAMSQTDILLSAHGAQLTNMIFMAPGGSVMEVFPFGWLEMAGKGQFIYRNLADWIGLKHEGYWRDPSTTPCKNASDVISCFSHYKDQPLGINVTYIGNWLGGVIEKFQGSSLQPLQENDKGNSSNLNTCECNNN